MDARDDTPSIREIAELTARLRRLTAAGPNADPAERAAFLLDKQALIDRIEAANRAAETETETEADAEPGRAQWSDADAGYDDGDGWSQ